MLFEKARNHLSEKLRGTMRKKAPLVCKPCGKQKEKTKRGNTIFQTFYLYLPHKTFKE